MKKKTLKYLFLILTGMFIGLFLFFTFPLSFSITRTTEEFSSEMPIALIPNAQNRGERCREDIIYATEANKKIHQGEGYEFIVNNYCAELQKKLIDAINNENLNEIRTLISQGANVRGRDISTFDAVNPLHRAAYKNYQIVKLILDNGADVNTEFCCCAACSTPLTIAVSNNDKATVELLLKRGAKVSFKQIWADEPFTVFDVAFEKNDEEILSLLAEKCDKSFDCRVEYRYTRLMDFFTKH